MTQQCTAYESASYEIIEMGFNNVIDSFSCRWSMSIWVWLNAGILSMLLEFERTGNYR